MGTAIFKTSARTLPGVLAHAKHALLGKPTCLSPGDTILIAQTLADLPSGQKQIRHKMKFVKARKDTSGETDMIWGVRWPWIIDCADIEELSRPFNIRELQVTGANYAQGGTVVYLDPLDEEEISKSGYYKCVEK